MGKIKKKIGRVYHIKNKVDGKGYVGFTNGPPEKRLKIHTEEACEKVRVARIGKKCTFVYERTPEIRAKISASHTGMKASKEAKAKMSKALIGNTRAKGYKHTPEALDKIGAASRGKKKSTATKAKMRVARIRYWAKRREAEGQQ